MDITVPEIDLNFRHYIGEKSDVIKDVLVQIRKYLKSFKIDETHRVIYSAIYNALIYYQNISTLSISGESANKTYLENTIKHINEDYNYLSEKYNIKNLDEINAVRIKNGQEPINQVIQVKCRVKSPVSAIDKILAKVEEYVKTGRELSRLNESLRDFIGIRFIVTAPPEIKEQGKKAESDFCYKVFCDLLEHNGIFRQINNEEPQETDFDFIPVNTDHDPKKLQKIKERAINKNFLFNPEQEGVYIPSDRPAYIEEIDEFVKDYRMFPKPMLYQRMHTCAHPFYSKLVPQVKLPTYILPPKSNIPALEYQVCTDSEEWWAEFGKASHKQYKDRTFHRLGIPSLITLDEDTNKIRLNRLDECMEDFYGYNFEDMFGIDYQEFLYTFDTEQRNEILAGVKTVTFNDKTQEYELKNNSKYFIICDIESKKFVNNLLQSSSKEELRKFYEVNGIADNTIYPAVLRGRKKVNPKIKVYSFNHPERLKLQGTKNRKVSKFTDGPEQ